MRTAARVSFLSLLLVFTAGAILPSPASAEGNRGLSNTDDRTGFGLLAGVKWRTNIMLDVEVPNTWSGFFGVHHMWAVSENILIGAFASVDVNYTSVTVSDQNNESSRYNSHWSEGDPCGRGDSWDAVGYGVQIGSRALFYTSESFAFVVSPLIEVWDVSGAIGCEDKSFLGSDGVYSVSELAVELGFAFKGDHSSWEVNLLHVGYNPDAGATGPFYPGLMVRSTF